MSKVLTICAVLVAIFMFSSCEKKRGAPEACFDTGSAELKSGKVLRFMNCSKYYDGTKWIVTDDMDVTLFTELTDTLRHFSYTFGAPGDYKVILNVWQSEGDTSTITTPLKIE